MSEMKANCSCGGNTGTAHISAAHVNASELTAASGIPIVGASTNETQFVANAAPNDMLSEDVRKLLSKAVWFAYQRDDKGDYYYYCWVMAHTADKVVYGYDSQHGYTYFQRSYSITNDGLVTLGDDVEEVILLTRIVPQPNTGESSRRVLSANEETQMSGETPFTPNADAGKDKAKDPKDNPEMENNGAAPTVNAGAAPAAAPGHSPALAPASAPASVPASAPTAAPAAPRTLAQMMAEFPAEVQEMMQSGLKLHAEKKNGIIAALKASGRCNFSDQALAGMNLEMLENLSTLAAVPTYEGVASPRTNAVADDLAIPAMPELFPSK